MKSMSYRFFVHVLLPAFVLLTSSAAGQTSFPAPGPLPSGLAYDGAYLYVSEASGFRTVYRMNPQSGAIIDSFLAPSSTGLDGGGNPSDMVFIPDATARLFISDIYSYQYPGTGKVYEIDSGGTVVLNSFSIPFRGGAIASDGIYLYVADFDSSQIVEANRLGLQIRSFTSLMRPAGMAFDVRTNLLWVIDEFDSGVSQITTKGDVVRTCLAPWNPGPLAIGAVTLVGSMLYIANESGVQGVPGTIYAVDPSTLICDVPLPMVVIIDVKPHVFPNNIYPASTGAVPVAIISTKEFDTANVDPTTVRFGAVGTEAPALTWALRDMNSDGRKDLLLRFSIQQTGMTCGVSFASITGRTYGGHKFRGTDAIKVGGCK